VLQKQMRRIVIAIGIILIILMSMLWILSPTILEPTPVIEATSTSSQTPNITPAESSTPVKPIMEVGSDEENAAFGKTVTDVPYNYNAMAADVMFRLDSDPQIEGSSISTFVAFRDETFTLFFKEAVDRNSVKEALKQKYAEQSNVLYPKLLLYWTNERQLHIKVLATQMKGWDSYIVGYRLGLSDVKKANGELLRESRSSAFFFAIVQEQAPNQLWRYSVDGKSKEQLTDFTDPFGIMPLDELNENLLLTRSTHYCACDALYPEFSSVYNRTSKLRMAYPLETPLMINYQGEGSFVADTRGFFYKQPPIHVKVPQSDTARSFQFEEYIFGANFSKNHDYLIMAVGEKEQTENYDLLILSLKTNKQQRYSHVIKGNTPEDQAYGRILPFNFKDDGKRVYYAATDWKIHKDLNYYYDWKAMKVVAWSPPKEVTGWTGFTESSDKVFRLYANGGVFKNDKPLKTAFMIENYYGGVWIPDTHLYAVPEHTGDRQTIVLIDADTLTLKPTIDHLSPDSYLYSVSSDGKWLTLRMKGSSE
jgi:hypothetical protein